MRYDRGTTSMIIGYNGLVCILLLLNPSEKSETKQKYLESYRIFTRFQCYFVELPHK